jgi:hypothetical protein
VLFLENKREFSMGLSDDEGSPGQGAATAKAKGVSRCDGAMGKVGWGHCGRFGGSGAPYSGTNGTFFTHVALVFWHGCVVWSFHGWGKWGVGDG